VDAQRRAARSPLPVDTGELLRDQPDATDVEASVQEIFSTEAALAMIGRLPREQAEMVMLRHVGGLEVSQVAEIMDKSPGAVRVAVHRGLRRLADLLRAVEAADDERLPARWAGGGRSHP
jgi:RNA polymerase sigma-70 factor (ECF subfamily)